MSWVTGREAALTLPRTFAPVDVGIVEIVDDVWERPEVPMILARVIGNSVSSVKHPTYVGQKVMVVQPVETDTHTPKGDHLLGAGFGPCRGGGFGGGRSRGKHSPPDSSGQ